MGCSGRAGGRAGGRVGGSLADPTAATVLARASTHNHPLQALRLWDLASGRVRHALTGHTAKARWVEVGATPPTRGPAGVVRLD